MAEEETRQDDRSHVREIAEQDAERLQEGPGLTLFGARLPYRMLIALAIFIVVFLLVWVALWSALGGAGLGLGWIVAAAVGLAAVKLLSSSRWAS